MGRKAYEPTEEHRKMVEHMASFGIDAKKIAKVIGIAYSILFREYKDVLETAKTKRIAQVAGRLFKAAMDGNVTAMIFIMKCQGGWKESDKDEKPLDEVRDTEIIYERGPERKSKVEP